jgi:hypothetical protein
MTAFAPIPQAFFTDRLRDHLVSLRPLFFRFGLVLDSAGMGLTRAPGCCMPVV